ncbi:hypothetical protein ACUOFU_17020 [Microbacterium arabinogalactanolyticum]|uniref:hypothetical protein n=1 Tax=Microbacterium arabinogalactanolyticum TaxID=69365 RepID=UPI004043ECAD
MNNVTALRAAGDMPTSAIETITPTGFEDVPAIMSPKTLAEVLEVKPLTLQRWRDATRATGEQVGPAWSEFPNSNVIRYTRVDVIAWMAANREGGVAS